MVCLKTGRFFHAETLKSDFLFFNLLNARTFLRNSRVARWFFSIILVEETIFPISLLNWWRASYACCEPTFWVLHCHGFDTEDIFREIPCQLHSGCAFFSRWCCRVSSRWRVGNACALEAVPRGRKCSDDKAHLRPPATVVARAAFVHRRRLFAVPRVSRGRRH